MTETEFMDVHVSNLQEAQVAIVGLGLMGGSLGGVLRGQAHQVIGIARRQETVDSALKLGMVDWATTDLNEGLAQADVVILATPVRVIIQQIAEIGPLLKPGTLLMDLGSTKGAIIKEMDRLPTHVQPLGGHPMCGKETSGIEVADPTLYQDRTFILSPLPRTSSQALDLGIELVEAVGSHPLVIKATRQDYLVAAVSHLPYMLACALVQTCDATVSADPLVWQIVAGGFRDTSRVAGSDITMMLDILATNRHEVVNAVTECATYLQNLAQLVAEEDEEKLKQLLTRIRDTRREMYA